MKTSAKYFLLSGWALRPGNMCQNGPKMTSLMMLLTKNPQPPPKKFFLSAI